MYAARLPDGMNVPTRPLSFLYEHTGIETQFTNLLDPDPRLRRVFPFHRPGALGADHVGADHCT
jgi:type I restriction enzyme R subunit